MTFDPSHLTPAVNDQVSEVAKAFTELKTNVQYGGGYTLTYVVTKGCGENGIHNYANLAKADAIPGVRLQYWKGDYSNERGKGAPIGQISNGNPTGPYGLQVWSTEVVLASPNGQTMQLNSNDPNFVNTVRQLVGGQLQAPQRSRF